MIKHISMARFKDSAEGCSKEENIEKVKAKLLALKEKVPNIHSVEFGIDILHRENDFDVISYSDYESMDDVKATVTHPAHDEFVALLSKVTIVSYSVTYTV